ncbi:hypothetical protein M378DRAFT_13258 [Amanita muscaria Koide BX008]|uniref:Uncharacterized protein n=1 Tax=Amanita muscaria (strain Koide BX008) TaxID=946122 RepID=A0A0C2WY69_AMAMK|nr:hypothetical protein M378DRAFT_13258 [Amanita muscaria Koide BX008]
MSVLTNPASSSTAHPSSTVTSMDCENDPTRTVRFDDECVLIPQLSRKRQHVVTKSVALPLWKRRPSPASHPTSQSDGESADDPVSPVTPEDNKQIVFKLPIPSFIVRTPRSPIIGGSPSASPRVQPLSPCLVHRSPSSSSSSRPSSVVRRTSLPLYHQKKGDSIITVPLRACCLDCVPITEECLREGEQWEVRFTRGARRRRSTSLDHASPRPSCVDGPDVTASSLSRLAITVDEVDKRRRSIEQIEEDDSQCESSSSQCCRHPEEPIPSMHPRSSLQEYTDNTLVPNVATLLLARSSPIQEEDEDQLFPLPSPRRTPSVSSGSLNLDPSPKPSPLHSRSSSRLPTPAASPNSSSACINSLVIKSTAQVDDVLTTPLTRLNSKREKPSDTPIVAKLPNRVTNNHTALPDSHRLSPRPRYTSSPLLGPSTPRSNPSNSPKGRKPSFGLPFLRAADALKGAGVDVLKGVGSMAGGAMHAMG